MTHTIVTKLTAAETSAVMIVENAINYAGSLTSKNGYAEAITAVVLAENNPTPQANYAAEQACIKFLQDNASSAIAAIEDRIDRRAKLASDRLTKGAQRALRGED